MFLGEYSYTNMLWRFIEIWSSDSRQNAQAPVRHAGVNAIDLLSRLPHICAGDEEIAVYKKNGNIV